MKFGYLIAGLLFLCNPTINILDILPDFIGYLLILKGLYELSDLDRRIAGARLKFRHLAWLSVFKFILSVFTCGLLDDMLYDLGLSLFVQLFDSTMVLVFVFVFGIFELMYLIPAFIGLFEGISFLEIRHTNHRARRTNYAKPRFGGIFDKTEFADGTAYFEVHAEDSEDALTAKFASEKVFFKDGKAEVFLAAAGFSAREDKRLYLYESDEARTMSVIFVIARTLATVLPEFTVISGTGGGYVQSGGSFGFSQMHGLLSYFLAAISLVVGILWAVRVVRYFVNFKNDGEFVSALKQKYESDVAANTSLWTMRKTLSFCFLSAFAYVFFLCLKLDWYYFNPEFAFGIAMLLAFAAAGEFAPPKKAYFGKIMAFFICSGAAYVLLFICANLFGGSAFPYLEKGFLGIFFAYISSFALSMLFYFLLIPTKKKTLLRMTEECTALSCPSNHDGTNYHRGVLLKEIGKKINLLTALERIYAVFSVVCMFATVPFSEDSVLCGLAWIFRILFGGVIVFVQMSITDRLQSEFEKVVA